MNFLSIIERKRDGGSIEPPELRQLVEEFTAGRIPDYQMAVFLMAVYFRGLSPEETRALTLAMRDSGEVLKFESNPQRPVVDKHSTGGVGDKVSLPLAPLLAVLGFRVPMISGRALGITGGTTDKLESIPGFRTRLEPNEIIAGVERVGCVMCGQSETMCPADRLLYALRDATGTVPSIPLITASILGKKFSEGISALVLDVKFGRAAFMRTIDEARQLARSMLGIAREAGVSTRALITDMDTPTGASAGNWIEVREAVDCLRGNGPADLRQLVIECAAQLLLLNGKADSPEQARFAAADALDSGEAARKWEEMLEAQGADMAAYRQKLANDTPARYVEVIASPADGWIADCDARIIGEVVRELGGGRLRKDAIIDPDVGFDRILPVGSPVKRGELLCRIHFREPAQFESVRERVVNAFKVTLERCAPNSPIVEIL